uniref:Phosphoenolpyruvate synthase n=1 Tax=Steinernema glaseri TaxID=37863 RepID=A0A1I7ZVU4_9BILA
MIKVENGEGDAIELWSVLAIGHHYTATKSRVAKQITEIEDRTRKVCFCPFEITRQNYVQMRRIMLMMARCRGTYQQ